MPIRILSQSEMTKILIVRGATHFRESTVGGAPEISHLSGAVRIAFGVYLRRTRVGGNPQAWAEPAAQS
jgi:hypothetical protein